MTKLGISNVGSIDRAVRIILGIAGIAIVFVGPKTLWGLIGIVPLATAFMGSCPAYSILGMSTEKSDGGGA